MTHPARSSTPELSGRPAGIESPAPLAHLVGRTRFVVLLAVLAVLGVAVSLFLLGSAQAAMSVWAAWRAMPFGEEESARLTVQFLEIVSVMLKAVVFYLVAVGFYSLFIAPLNVAVSLGVETLHDLESKVVSVVVVILAVTFLEHFIRWERPLETLQQGGAMALVVLALVFFQFYSHRAKQDQQARHPGAGERAERRMLREDEEAPRCGPSAEADAPPPSGAEPGG